MKKMKKLAATLIALFLVAAILPAAALAAPANIETEAGDQPTVTDPSTSGTLTIEKNGSASTFAVYRLYGMSVKTGEKIYSYTQNPEFSSALPADVGNFKSYTEDNLSTLTKLLREIISSDSSTLKVYGKKSDTETKDKVAPDATATASRVTGTDTYKATFSGLSLGYYLVIETKTDNAKIASKDFLVSVPSVVSGAWSYTVTAKCKDSTVTFDKTIAKAKDDIETKDLNGVTRNIGDVVDYRLDADVPQYDDTASNITFAMHDTMSKGLTFDPSSVVVKGYDDSGSGTDLTADKDYTLSSSDYSAADGTTITLNFDYADIKDYKNVKVFYSAELNENAVIGSAGNPNEAYLDYTQTPGVTTSSEHQKTYVTTFGIKILKKDRNDSSPLQYAEFGLYSDETFTTPVGILAKPQTTDINGEVFFKGIKEGTYYLKEITAPDGYSLLSETVKITIAATLNADGTLQDFTCKYAVGSGTETETEYTYSDEENLIKLYAKFDVLDDKGFSLPGTGGIGTKIFTASGIGILAVGGCMTGVYTKKKKKPSSH